MGETMRSPTVSTKLRQIAEQAKQYLERVFTTLAFLIDVEFLMEAHRKTRKGGATGIDKVTAAEYEANPLTRIFKTYYSACVAGCTKHRRYYANG